MSSQESRTMLIGTLWFFSALVLIAIFVSAAAQGELTVGHMLMVSVMLGLAIAGTLFVHFTTRAESEESKAKRQNLDKLLRRLSDEDLMALKERLSDDDFHREPTLDRISDDGEMVMRR